MARISKQKLYKESVAIVGDGQTERIYFADLRDTDRPENLIISPDYPRKLGSYKGVLARAIELAEVHSIVYALIDMDKIIQDNQMSQYQKDKQNAETNGIVVLENNPCFEMWLLLHHIHTGKLFQNCNEVGNELKKAERIPGYDKSERFLNNAKLYKKYKTLIQSTAIPNAKRLEDKREEKDVLYPRAETFRFFEWYFKKSVGN